MEATGGDHWWGSLVWASGGDHWWGPLVETTGGGHWWRPLVGATGGDHWWGPLVVGDHWWEPLVETTGGSHWWRPLVGATGAGKIKNEMIKYRKATTSMNVSMVEKRGLVPQKNLPFLVEIFQCLMPVLFLVIIQ